MVSGFISRIVILVFGTLYPAYASYKAVRTKNVREYVKWMMYWIVFALFTCAETFTDLFLSFWFPFYYELKIITVIYLLSPATKGSSILYRKFVHPVLIKREQEIDEYIAKAKEQGYHTMLNLGSKGVNYATSLIMQTALKSGGGLMNQLKKSYSLNDLSGEQNFRKANSESADASDGPYGEDPRLIRRGMIQGPHSPTSSTGHPGLYFPEADLNQLPADEDFRQIPSYEEISSGYSSGEPYYYAMQQSKGCNLVRTASLGPSSRVRTRASAKQGLPKRSSLSEGGSTLSAMEPYEGQNETDNRFNFPLAHSASFPFVFPPPQYFLSPEQQHLFGNLTQNQIFAFINQSQFPQFLSNKIVGPEKNSEGIYESVRNRNQGSSSFVILEEASENKNQSAEESGFLELDFPATDSATNKEAKSEDINTPKGVKNENSEKAASPEESLDSKEKSFQERSGRYNKKPAPTPPTEESHSKMTSLTVEEEETAFFTPNASPKPERKLNTLEEKSCGDTEKLQDNNLLDVPKKSKSKAKKTDFNIQKKLHMPKMSFSFWHQKSGKQASASESSSVASIEIPTNSENKSDTECYIPLRGDEATEGNGASEECKLD